ncbi:hypothetical protein ACFZCP_38265 [Streptomyces sp. NPDC007971]|uniref:hypothetical protein n=1 Tax=Streptomyces sp. NPDC007971 TaxID=3364799 RepID=UPI0036E3CD04
MHEADPAFEELMSSARNAPSELVTRLVHSDDPQAARLGRAIEHIKRTSTHAPPTEASDGGRIVNPITHDPAW